MRVVDKILTYKPQLVCNVKNIPVVTPYLKYLYEDMEQYPMFSSPIIYIKICNFHLGIKVAF